MCNGHTPVLFLFCTQGVDQILQSRVRELQQQLQSCETEKQAITQWLIRTEAELASAQDIIRRKQQQVHVYNYT